MVKLEKMMRFFSPVVLLYATILVIAAFAQPPVSRNYAVEDLSRRVDNIELLQIDRRLTVLETIQREAENQSFWSRVTTGGTGLLLVEASVRLIRKRREP